MSKRRRQVVHENPVDFQWLAVGGLLGFFAGSAIAYSWAAKQFQARHDAVMRGLGATVPDASTTPVAQSAATLLAALQAQGCTVPTNTVEIFQNDWNDAQPDSQLTASGVYDAPTATALQQILTAAGNTTTVPAACPALTMPTTTLTSPAAPVDYTVPVLLGATAVAAGLVWWGWRAGSPVRRAALEAGEAAVASCGGSAAKHFFVPPDLIQNYRKYTPVHFSGRVVMKVACVPLARLRSALDADSWPTKRMIGVLRRGTKVPPITITARNGKLEVEDGNTRVAALKAMGERGRVPALAVAWNPQDKAFLSLRTLAT